MLTLFGILNLLELVVVLRLVLITTVCEPIPGERRFSILIELLIPPFNGRFGCNLL